MAEQVINNLDKDVVSSIAKLYESRKKYKTMPEFEFIFKDDEYKYIGQKNHIDLLRYMKLLSDHKKLELVSSQCTLDAFYSYEQGKSLRATIHSGNDNVNIDTIIQKLSQWKNKNILQFKYILYEIRESLDPKKYELIEKVKDKENAIEFNNFDVKVRLAEEIDLMNKKAIDNMIKNYIEPDLVNPKSGNYKKVNYRFKERTSLYILKTSDKDYIKIDLTTVRSTYDIQDINKATITYELEIETMGNPPDALNVMYEYTAKLLKIIQQSNYIISNKVSNNVLNYYRTLLTVNINKKNLVTRNPISLEVIHISSLSDNYAVTDKADGERYFLIIYDACVYLIDTNLHVKDTGIVLSDKLAKKYNGTIFDTEYIFLPDYNRHLVMVFDCLIVGESDMRRNPNLLLRVAEADKVIKECFVFGKQKNYEFKNIPNMGEFNLDKLVEFHETELKNHMNTLNHDIKLETKYPLIRRKYFIPSLGAKRWEIFRYTSSLWLKYKNDKEMNYPYLLDGLIYHPLEQTYEVNKELSKYPEYKWKPQDKNSLDFYVTFRKDSKTNNPYIVYDNSFQYGFEYDPDEQESNNYNKNKPYRICNLHVGAIVDRQEKPVLFNPEQELHEAYLYLKDGETRDIDGNIIEDKTVVEFYYDNNQEIEPKMRWVPMRTRYEKTESVKRFGIKYGNNIDTANKTWNSMYNPITIEDFIDLSNVNGKYDKTMNDLKKRVSHAQIVAINKENKYYQERKRYIATSMKKFHNFLKDIIIVTYCHPTYNNNKQLSMLDMGCGEGGDLMKYFTAKIALYVGFDISYNDIHAPQNGALSRYDKFRKQFPNFPKCHFIVADMCSILDYVNQNKALSGMGEDNKKLIERFFAYDLSKDKQKMSFDRMTCQFALHFSLKNSLTFANVKQNIKNNLRDGGYFTCTTFDAKIIIGLLKDKDSFTVTYTDDKGIQRKLYEIVKKYNDSEIETQIGTGLPIDVFMTWINADDNYFTEYLVDVDFLVKELEKDADLELVDTDLFINQHEILKDFFVNGVQYINEPKTKKTLTDVSQFYEINDMNNASLMYSKLSRYYVFRKKSTNKKQTGSSYGNSGEYSLDNVNKFKIPNMSKYNANYSFVNSIHHILQSHQLISKTTTATDMCNELGIRAVPDIDIDDNYIKEFGKQLVITHTIKNKDMKVLNGVNFHVAKRNIHDDYYINHIISNKNKQNIILMNEGTSYKPLYYNNDKAFYGVHKNDDIILEKLGQIY